MENQLFELTSNSLLASQESLASSTQSHNSVYNQSEGYLENTGSFIELLFE